MKRFVIGIGFCLLSITLQAQDNMGKEKNDSIIGQHHMIDSLGMDSIAQALPEVMVKGERPHRKGKR